MVLNTRMTTDVTVSPSLNTCPFAPLQATCPALSDTSYDACTLLSGGTFPFEFSWTYNAANRTLHGAIRGSSPAGWFGLALTDPTSPGLMIGSNAIIVKQDPTSKTGEAWSWAVVADMMSEF